MPNPEQIIGSYKITARIGAGGIREDAIRYSLEHEAESETRIAAEIESVKGSVRA